MICGARNLCLIINVHDANNIPDGFQVNGDAKVVLHLWMTEQSTILTAKQQTNVFRTDLLLLCFWHWCVKWHLNFLLLFSIHRQSYN